MKSNFEANCIAIFCFLIPKGPAVTSVPLVTTATQANLVGSASRAIATATSTPRTLSHVTRGPANASSACTTPTAHPVPTVNTVTMATLWPMTADVSDEDRYYSTFVDFFSSCNLKLCYLSPNMMMHILLLNSLYVALEMGNSMSKM